MPGDRRYGRNKVREIVRCLAAGPGDARRRVSGIIGNLHAIGPEDFPEGLRNEFIAIVSELEKRRKPGGGYCWTNKTAASLAGALFDLYLGLESDTR